MYENRLLEFTLDIAIFYSDNAPLTANALKNSMDDAGLFEGYVETVTIDSVGEVEVRVTNVWLSLAYEEKFCPSNSAGATGSSNGEGVECICASGYIGDISWVSTGNVREYRGECVTDGTGAVVAGVLAAGTVAAVTATSASAAAVATAATAAAVEASSAATAAASSVSAHGSSAFQGISTTTQGAATSVLAQMQLLALLSKVPAVYKRAPTFAATFRSSGWLNLQGIPGWWGSSNASTSTSTSTSTATHTGNLSRRLAGTSAVGTDATDGTFYNCSLDSVSSSTSSLVPDDFAEFMSAWFYTIVLIFFLALGQAVAYWVLSNCRPHVMEKFNREVLAEMEACHEFLQSWNRSQGVSRSRPESPIELVQVAVEASSEAKELEANGDRGSKSTGMPSELENRESSEDARQCCKSSPCCRLLMKLTNQVHKIYLSATAIPSPE